jgi:hypothetical protein
MTNKTDWQDANRRLVAEQREALGDPPTAEEMLAYSRGEMSADQEERIRDLLVAYPDLARMYAVAFPAEAETDISSEAIDRGFRDVQRRLGVTMMPARTPVRYYLPTAIAAALALVFLGLYVQAESRARNDARTYNIPRILGAPQELDPDGNRGPAAPTLLRKDGEAYLLKPHLINQVRYPHYTVELRDAKGTAMWTTHAAQPDSEGAFQIVIPHAFLRPGAYQLRISGIDGQTRSEVGAYDVAVPAE